MAEKIESTSGMYNALRVKTGLERVEKGLDATFRVKWNLCKQFNYFVWDVHIIVLGYAEHT